jgi:hypothetical protein
MRPVCRRRLDRDRPGFGKPCNLCFGPFGSLGRVGFLEVHSNTADHVHTMRASLSWSQLLCCNKLIKLTTDSLSFSRRVAVLLIKQCDILLVESTGYMSSYDGLLGEHLFCIAGRLLIPTGVKADSFGVLKRAGV